jgi:hypothetical protein
MFIVDFDDTLFDTRPGFRDARLKAAAGLGISPELYQETYRVARRSADNIATYSTRRHAQILAEHGFDEEQVVKELETTTTPEALSKLLYPDAHDFLKKLKSFGEPMVLLSLGDSEFQMLKVQGSGIERDDIERGQVIAKVGSITPHTEFEAEVYVLTKEEGGRHTPFIKGYKPQFFVRTTDVTGEVELPAGVEMVMPGDTIKFVVRLIAPIAMEDGMNFAIREGGRTVGSGVVTKIIK